MKHPPLPIPRRALAGAGLAAVLVLTGCATRRSASAEAAMNDAVAKRLAEILDAAETRDLPRLDSYHWYGPHFTKFSSTGNRLDAAAAREGEHKGLGAITGLKLRADGLKIDRFGDTAVATFVMTANIPSATGPVTKRERGTLVFVRHDGSWRIVHEHFSAAE